MDVRGREEEREGERERGREEERRGEEVKTATTGAVQRGAHPVTQEDPVSCPVCPAKLKRAVKEPWALRGSARLGEKGTVCFHIHTSQAGPEMSVL